LMAASEAADMLPLGLAAGARVTRPVSRGQEIPRSAVRLPEDSFAAILRRLQETSRDPDE
jgi:predicted homoserine dehydrogenase-like protein